MAEGFATIVGTDVPKISAHAGEIITIYANIRNDGVDDTLFVKLYDADTGEQVDGWAMANISAGVTWYVGWTSLVMPNRNWNLRLIAGHVEEVPQPLMMSDVTDMDLNFLPTGGIYIIEILAGTDLGFCDKNSVYYDGVSVTKQQVRLRLQNVGGIIAGSSLVVKYDGAALTIYLPDVSAAQYLNLYPATDGSTYYDEALTELAQKVP